MKNFFKINRALVAKKKFFTLTLALMATITLWAADVAISVTFNSSNKPQNGLTLTSGNVDYGTQQYLHDYKNANKEAPLY